MNLDCSSDEASLNAWSSGPELDCLIQDFLEGLGHSPEPGYRLLRVFALFKHVLLTVASHKDSEVPIRKLVQEQQNIFATVKLYNDINVAIDVRNEVAHVVDGIQPSTEEMDRATVSFLQAIEVIRPTATIAIQQYCSDRVLNQQSFSRPTGLNCPSYLPDAPSLNQPFLVSASEMPRRPTWTVNGGIDLRNVSNYRVIGALGLLAIGAGLGILNTEFYYHNSLVGFAFIVSPLLIVLIDEMPLFQKDSDADLVTRIIVSGVVFIGTIFYVLVWLVMLLFASLAFFALASSVFRDVVIPSGETLAQRFNSVAIILFGFVAVVIMWNRLFKSV